MKLLEYFKDFLENTVNLNESRLTLLDERVGAITNFLKENTIFKEHFRDVIPQGSYAHKTIIRPVQENDEFDADVLLYLNEVDGWAATDYVENLYRCFRSSSTYKDKVNRRTRCVTVDYACDFHIDVVPYLERHSQKYITNRHDDRYELTDPEGYNAWLDEKNKVAGRHLVKVIRSVKYLRDHKQTFSVKSIMLSVLLGSQVNDAALLQVEHCYDDVPTTLKTVMDHLSEYVQANLNLPAIMDPSGTGESFSDRWDQTGWSNFRIWIIYYAKKINDAYSDTDRDSSLRKWQSIFGDKFKKASVVEMSGALVKASTNLPIRYQNTEQRLPDLGIQIVVQPRSLVRVEGYVLKEISMGAYYLSKRGGKVHRGRQIHFKVAACNVLEPYDIYWKVLNRGSKAKEEDCIRGQIERGNRVWRIDEKTQFVGHHYIECYIVKNGVCVAMDRQEVNII